MSEVQIQGDVVDSPRRVLLSKPMASLACLGALVAVAQLQPWERLKVLEREQANASSQELTFQPEQRLGESVLEEETLDRPELALPENPTLPRGARGPIAESSALDEAAIELPGIDEKQPPVPIVDPKGSLDPFYRALGQTKLEKPGAVTRITYFGDSLVASDYVTATLRRKMQTEFGDAGHGFMLIANAWPSYFHNDVFRFATRGWKVSRIVGPYAKDGLYGLGGVSFVAPSGVRARFGTAEKGHFGLSVSKFIISYLKQPGGGLIRVNLDGEPHTEVDTKAERVSSGFHEIEVEDGAHRIELVTARGMTRAFGVVMERDGPGVVVDAVGIQGARIRFLDKQDDEHWAEQLEWRNPNLLVYHFGANESGDGFAYSMEDYDKTMRAVLKQGLAALPNAGCLVMAAMDRARKVDTGMITVPIIPHIVEQQEKTAAAVGCAFWNTYAAMGGRGSMATWVRRGLGQADLTHPTGVGAEVLGNWIYRALIAGYEAYRERQKQ